MDELFHSSGRPKNIYYGKGSGTRGDIFSVRGIRTDTTFSIGNNYRAVYARAVEELLHRLERAGDDTLRARLLAALPALLEHYGLAVETRTVEVLVRRSAEEKCSGK